MKAFSFNGAEIKHLTTAADLAQRVGKSSGTPRKLYKKNNEIYIYIKLEPLIQKQSLASRTEIESTNTLTVPTTLLFNRPDITVKTTGRKTQSYLLAL